MCFYNLGIADGVEFHVTQSRPMPLSHVWMLKQYVICGFQHARKDHGHLSCTDSTHLLTLESHGLQVKYMKN